MQDKAESDHQHQQYHERPEVPRFKPFHRPPKSHQPEQGRHHDHRVHARPLPVTAAQVQPHPEFIERQTHRHAIQQRRDLRLPAHRPPEHAVTAHRRQQKNPVVQVMHMRSVQEEIKIRQLIGHDEKHKDPRQQERHEKTEQGASRQFMRRLARDGMFRVQKLPAGLSRFLNCVEKFFGCSIHPASSDSRRRALWRGMSARQVRPAPLECADMSALCFDATCRVGQSGVMPPQSTAPAARHHLRSAAVRAALAAARGRFGSRGITGRAAAGLQLSRAPARGRTRLQTTADFVIVTRRREVTLQLL